MRIVVEDAESTVVCAVAPAKPEEIAAEDAGERVAQPVQEDTRKPEQKKPKKRTHNQKIARRGESAAAAYLENRGYEILQRNWRCKYGEVDIVALDEDTLVFVEVKTRTNIDMGFPEEAVDAAKRDKYEKIAAAYLVKNRTAPMALRFDVIGLLVVAPDQAVVRHHINAFGVM